MAGIDNNTLLYLRGDSFEDLSPNPKTVVSGAIISEDAYYINANNLPIQVNDITFGDTWTVDFFAHRNGSISSSLFSKGYYTSGVAGGFTFRIINPSDGRNGLELWTSQGTTLSYPFQNTGVYLNDTFDHYAFTYDGAKMNFFINGKLTKSFTFSFNFNQNNSPLIIGKDGYKTGSDTICIKQFRLSNTIRYTEDFTPPIKPYNSITINKTNQTDTNIEFNIEKLGQETINKVEVLVNGVLSETYTDSFDNIDYLIDTDLCAIGNNNITIRVTYDDNYVEEKVLTHTVTLDNLPTTSNLKDVMARRNILNNTVKVQKNILRDIIIQKNVEVLDEDNKLSKLIDKIELLGDYYDGKLWLYKNGDECIDTTGGWQESSENTASVGKSFTKNATHMRLWSHNNNALGAGYWLETINTINTTPYAKLKARLTKTGTGYRNRMYVGRDMGVNYYDYQNQVDGEFIAEIDLANINGEYNICFTHFTASGQNSEILIHEVWLEE